MMRVACVLWLSIVLAGVLAGCGSKARGSGGGDDDAGAPPDAMCIGSACVVDCRGVGKPDTTISGTVFAPNGTLPLFGINVYIPTHDPGPLPDGASCDRCSDNLPGDPAVAAVSDEAGRFTLTAAPAGDNVPVVISTGKWRKQIVVPHVDACSDNALAATDTSLPRDRTQGDMPRIAIATGFADSLECLARKLGVADTEITNFDGGGHVQLYVGNGGKDRFIDGFAGGSGAMFSPASDLWSNPDRLKTYDIVMLSCEGAQFADEKPQAAMDAVKAYADLGGRLFLSHWHNIWLEGEPGHPEHGEAAWESIATWTDNEDELVANSSSLIDELANPKGTSFASWMLDVGGSTQRDTIALENQVPDAMGTVLSTGRSTCSGVNAGKAERWVYLPTIATPAVASGGTQNFQFTTPNEVDPGQRCGKVVFSDMHVSGTSGAGDYPDSCGSNELTPQEKALAFMFFDIASCVGALL